MSVEPACHDALYRLAQAGDDLGVRLVRLGELIEANRYWAEALEFDADGEAVVADEPPFAVINLAEPADAPGTVPSDTDAVALDAEGSWVDRPDTPDLTAGNLAELSLGPGAALEVNTRVVLSVIEDQCDPPVARYVFDHPAYAKYLD